ncbi:hypothetical protein SEA_PHARAOH_50 [Mycobacterium phage Pharaoh]|uniref:Uncharacterized protein n=1 Tax=Mycobacterium phage Pharaoh TaxID=2530140 RepID=A0A481W3A1_9CAUD|nr:hypothetical protein KIV59_gp40 [Mycobacterium phage Pharaoh]QBJ00239.1 hypothetical protein SEA_PHARAOH_50 [Mycobacterium phage Pharaoh]
MTPTRLPYLHKNARSRQITSAEVREVFAEEVTRNLDRRIDRDDYLKKVMP